MCGIFGFNFEDRALLKRGMDILQHRGPDDSGYFTDKNISLGHRRLSIIDLSKKGHQPMQYNNLTIIYNGEIYNFKEIREELIRKKHRFISNSDTEVMLHAYEEYGENCLDKFNGMFAFCIYDSKKKILFLARDRVGVKPLYYYLKDGKFIFASEIKAILLDKDIKRKVNLYALHDFLTFRANSLNQTIFDDIYKLDPGYYMVFDLRKNRLIKKKYWEWNVNVIDKSEEYYAKNILERLKKSVELRLISDVPLGIYLSSGIDSGSIAALMSKLTDKVNSFSVGFGIQQHDELKMARQTAEYFNTNHREIIVDAETSKLWPKIVWHLDEPMSDATCIPTYLLSENIKKYATVVLTGDGGDELFAGYFQYKMMNYYRYLKYLPVSARKKIPYALKIIPNKIVDSYFKYASSLGKEGIRRFSEFISSNNNAEAYLNIVSVFNEEEKKKNYSDKSNKKLKDYSLIPKFNDFLNKDNFMSNVVLLDTKNILTESYLMKVDKNTMAFGVEARTPYLDYNLVELSSNIPFNMKLKNGIEKYILRKAMSELPKFLLKRKKTNFFVPIDHWFNGELNDFSRQLLDKKIIEEQGFFNYNYIEKIFRNFKSSRLFYARQLFSLMTFQIWHKIYIEDNISSPNKIKNILK